MKPVSVISALKPLHNRIYLGRMFICLLLAVIAAGIMSFLLSCRSLLFPVIHMPEKLTSTYIAFLGLSFVIILFLKPDRMETAKTADSYGLKERAVTALELLGDTGCIAVLQRKDTLDAINRTDFKKLYRLKPRPALLYAAVIPTVLTLLLQIIPTEAKNEAKHIETLVKIARKQAETVAEARKDIRKDTFTAAELLEPDKVLQQLERELRTANTEDKVLKALFRAKNETETLNSLSSEVDLNKLADNLSKNDSTRNIADALKSQNPEEFKNLLQKTESELSGLDAGGRNQLAEEIKKAAEEVGANSELAKDLNDLAGAVAAGKLKSAEDAMRQLNHTLAEMSGRDAKLKQALSELQRELQGQLSRSLQEARRSILSYEGNERFSGEAAGRELSRPQGGEGNQSAGSGGEQNQRENAEGSGGQSSVPGNAPGNGQGNEFGPSGEGDGAGRQGANGAGGQSSDGNQGYSEEQAGGPSRMSGDKTVKDYESIYVPERLGEDADAQASQVQGNKGAQGGSSRSNAAGAPVEKGTAIPYDEVLKKYKDEAMNRLEDNPVPPGMEEMVRDYFTSLE